MTPVRQQGCKSLLWQPPLSNLEHFAALISSKHVNRAAIKANVQRNAIISSDHLQNTLEDCRVTSEMQTLEPGAKHKGQQQQCCGQGNRLLVSRSLLPSIQDLRAQGLALGTLQI